MNFIFSQLQQCVIRWFLIFITEIYYSPLLDTQRAIKNASNGKTGLPFPPVNLICTVKLYSACRKILTCTKW